MYPGPLSAYLVLSFIDHYAAGDNYDNLQGKMNGSPIPFGLLTARNREKYFLYGTADREAIIQDEDAWHSFFRCHTFIGKIRHGRAIVSEDNSIVNGRPRKNVFVFRTGKSDILNANEVEVRSSEQQAANDVAVKVFIR